MDKEKVICDFRWVIFIFWLIGLIFFSLYGLGIINNNLFGGIAIFFGIFIGIVCKYFKRFKVTDSMKEERPSEDDCSAIKWLEWLYSPVFGSWFWMFFSLALVSIFVGDLKKSKPAEILISLFPVYLGMLASFLNKKRIRSLLFWR